MENQEHIPSREDFDLNDFRYRFLQHLRAEEFEQAGRLVESVYLLLSDPVRRACEAIEPDRVRTTGWPEIISEIRRLSEKRPITCVGFDLSSHVNEPEIGNEPGVETSYYSDHYYTFSVADISDIHATMDSNQNPWQGCFEDIDHSLEVEGLKDLLRVIREAQDLPRNRQSFDAAIGICCLILAFHRSLVRDGRAAGLPVSMPIVVGEHDFYGPYMDAAYRVEGAAKGRVEPTRAPPVAAPGLGRLFKRTVFGRRGM